MSTCADPNAQTIVGHNNIISSSYNSGPDGGVSCCNHGNIWDANDSRFQIINSSNAGIDEFTINSAGVGMPRIPPGYTSCIRLGDPRATGVSGHTSHSWSASDGNKGAEALFYTLRVSELNALLFINYAVVGRCYSHATYEAGEFLIRVVKQNDDGTWPNAPINDDLWFKVSAPPIPTNNVPAYPWLAGKPGSTCGSTTCAYVYKPWTKVAISLSEYINQTVRIEMYTSDCIYAVDPIYAYICGDYQPMMIMGSGCPDPESSVVDTLRAPEGMLTYRWYVATHGPEPNAMLNNPAHMDSVEFRQISPLTGTTTDNTYAAQLEDFIVSAGPDAGDTAARQTFMCIMTSALDPAKPFESRLYTNVDNRKPIVGYGYEAHCDTSATFINGSIVYAYEGQEDDSTHWIFYADTLGLVPLDTVYGNIVDYTFPNIGRYAVKLFVSTGGAPCTAAELFVCDIIGNPPADFTTSEHRLCESDQVVLTASDEVRNNTDLTLQWAVDSVPQTETSGIFRTTLDVGPHLLSLTATTSNGCSATTYDSVNVFGQPSIDLSSTVPAICLGDSVTLSAAGTVDYTWNSAPYDPSIDNIQGQSSFTVHPTVNTTYYLLPSTDNPCSIEGAEVHIEVIPYPTPTIRTSVPRVNMENSNVTVQDVSPYTASSRWAFSDGYTAEGPRVSHTFGDLSGDSVSITLHTCNRLDCCADTTVYLPIAVTTVWFPNVFMPDDDQNNRFGIHTTLTMLTYELSIYNRNGALVHSTTDQHDQWDGTIDGIGPAPQGVYTWFCRYSYGPNAYYTASGTVTLIR